MVDHYENFPVASFLLPKALRRPVAAIYWFARMADDMADEGDASPPERLAQLAAFREELVAISTGKRSAHPIFQGLAPVIEQFTLPYQLFFDLLDAFAQDVRQDRYANYDELLDYCRRSANPIGRLMLHLFHETSPENLRDSDAICSALQLINHWQDVGIDLNKGTNGRIYLPQSDLAYFGLTDDQLLRRPTAADFSSHFRQLMKFQIDRARALMLSGAPLGWRLPGRMGLEIRAIIAGGLRILEKIEALNYDVLDQRPVLTASDWPGICWRTLVRPLN